MSRMRSVLFRASVVAVALLLGACASTRPLPPGATETALDRYVMAEDTHYKYELLRTVKGEGYDTHFIKMTSQQWLDADTVDRPIWEHLLVIVRPHNVATNTGFLYIGGGNNGDLPPADAPERIVALATATNSVVSQLYMVPNQPLVFLWDETRERVEDEIIAYTWDKYLRTGEDKWPLRLPMTKSAVRAMDTVTDFCASDAGGGVLVNRFVVAGGSKRGWTTWTTAAVDRRVVAIAPMVIDLLNIEPSFIHHYEVYGRFADAVKDYEDMELMEWLGTPENHALYNIVEPYQYRSRYTMPKFLINATGDQFFLPDSSQFYFDDLPGEKYLRYVPNGDHSLGGTDAGESLVAWYHAIVNNIRRPDFFWTFEGPDAIRVFPVDAPQTVRLWRATNPTERNFQKQTIGEAWASVELVRRDDGSYIGRVNQPEAGYTAYFVELTYPSGTDVPFKFTTPVRVIPDVTEHEFEYARPWERENVPEHR